MGLGNSSPRCCNRVHPDTRLFGVVSIVNPVSIHLKDFDVREIIILQAVVDLEVGAEVGPLVVEGAGTGG